MYQLDQEVFSVRTSDVSSSLALSREANHRSSLLSALAERRRARQERRTARSWRSAVAHPSV